MSQSKTPFTETVTMRLTKTMKAKIEEICETNVIGEADIIRFLLDAGMQIADDEGGFVKLMEKRAQFIAHSARPSRKENTSKKPAKVVRPPRKKAGEKPA